MKDNEAFYSLYKQEQKKQKIKKGTRVKYLGLDCTVLNVRGTWLELVSDTGAEFAATKDYVDLI